VDWGGLGSSSGSGSCAISSYTSCAPPSEPSGCSCRSEITSLQGGREKRGQGGGHQCLCRNGAGRLVPFHHCHSHDPLFVQDLPCIKDPIGRLRNSRISCLYTSESRVESSSSTPHGSHEERRGGHPPAEAIHERIERAGAQQGLVKFVLGLRAGGGSGSATCTAVLIVLVDLHSSSTAINAHSSNNVGSRFTVVELTKRTAVDCLAASPSPPAASEFWPPCCTERALTAAARPLFGPRKLAASTEISSSVAAMARRSFTPPLLAPPRTPTWLPAPRDAPPAMPPTSASAAEVMEAAPPRRRKDLP
jgi:hypothetical protein